MPQSERPWVSRTRRYGLGSAVALLLVVLWALVLWFSFSQQRRLLGESERALALTNRALAGQTGALLASARGNLLVAQEWLRQHPGSAPTDDPGLRQLIRTMDQASEGHMALGLVIAGGRILAPVDGSERLVPLPLPPLDATQQLPLADARLGLYTAVQSTSGQHRVWPLVLHSDAAAAHGVQGVVALIDLDRLAALHDTLRQRPNGSVILIRRDGVVISRVPEWPGLVGSNISSTNAEIAAVLARDEGSGVYDSGATDGVKRLFAYRHVADFPLSALVSQGVDDALVTYRERRALALALCALLTGLIFALAWVLTRSQHRTRIRLAQLAAVSDEAPIGMFRAALDGRLTYVNSAYLRIHQLPRSEAADGWLSLLRPEARAAALAEWRRTLAGRAPLHVERRMRRRDGTMVLVSVNSNPVVVDGQVIGHVGTVADITEQARAEKALRTLTAIFDVTTDYVVQTDVRGRLTYMNPAARRRRGLAPDAPIEHLRVSELIPPETVERNRHEIVPTATAQGVWIGETIQWDADRREVAVSHIVIAHRGHSGEVEYFSGIMRDITTEKAGRLAQQRSEAVLRAVAEAIPAVVAVIDSEQRYRFTNTAFEQWRGASRHQLVGRTIREVLGDEDHARSLPYIERALAGETVNFERSYAIGGTERHLKVTYIPLHLADGGLDGFIGVAQDITEHRVEQARLRDLNRIDPLTGAFNRTGLEHVLEQRACSGTQRLAALLYVDLDHFKQINDQHGHSVGDEVLRIFVQRLRQIVRAGDAIARLGGDEFAVLLDDLQSPVNAESVAEKVLAAAIEPMLVNGLLLQVSASVGIALWAPGGHDARELIERADRQLYRAKAEGRGRYALDS